jgi:beta-galactosidase/beta-glucuronidase
MPRHRISFLLALVVTAVAQIATAQETERQYLSGRGKDDAVPWQFRCSAGRRANEWTTIRVPSNWELQGFGIFSYGVDREPKTPVRGDYRTAFTPPADWSGRRIFLVFEGAMTDTEARVNGQVVGPIHQGGYYRFKYEVTKLVRLGQENQLDVAVVDESADRTVNAAERRGDYWNYGGIYRPVYLEAVPAEFIERVAIDARADGSIAVSAFADGVVTADNIDALVLDLDGHPIGQPFVQPISSTKAEALLKWHVEAPLLWTAEKPNLYQLEVLLKKGNTVLHALRQRFGFRTIEVRPADGIYVNGRKIILKGSDRHSFWPDSGRCTSEQLSRDDALLMKDMNANAVRMSHYPPDQHFLDTCD